MMTTMWILTAIGFIALAAGVPMTGRRLGRLGASDAVYTAWVLVSLVFWTVWILAAMVWIVVSIYG